MHSPSRARLPKLSAILAFETAARTGSPPAADTLALTAAAVSQQIRQLEQHRDHAVHPRQKRRHADRTGHGLPAYVQEAFETLRGAAARRAPARQTGADGVRPAGISLRG